MSLTSTWCKVKKTILRNMSWNMTSSLHFQPVYIIYLDYRKAFDSVLHERLLEQLEAFGIYRSIRMGIHRFLTDRWQKISAVCAPMPPDLQVASLKEVSLGMCCSSCLLMTYEKLWKLCVRQ